MYILCEFYFLKILIMHSGLIEKLKMNINPGKKLKLK